MKFVVGNKVKVKDREAVLEYSYGQKYGNGDTYGGWKILFLDNGTSLAWVYEDQMDFISTGGVELIDVAKKTRIEIEKRNTDLKYIKQIICNKKQQNSISSDSILKLFNEIKFNTSFLRNGEYFCLWNDWYKLEPIFSCLFNEDRVQMNNIIRRTFNEKYLEEYLNNFNNLYEKVNTCI